MAQESTAKNRAFAEDQEECNWLQRELAATVPRLATDAIASPIDLQANQW